jgi:hypothetical protein
MGHASLTSDKKKALFEYGSITEDASDTMGVSGFQQFDLETEKEDYSVQYNITTSGGKASFTSGMEVLSDGYLLYGTTT